MLAHSKVFDVSKEDTPLVGCVLTAKPKVGLSFGKWETILVGDSLLLEKSSSYIWFYSSSWPLSSAIIG